MQQSVLARKARMATRIAPTQQDGGSEVDAQIICYRAAISACEKKQEWQLALGFLSRMAESKVEADTICYSATVSACEKGNEWQLALDLLSRMAEAKWMRTPFARVRHSVPARKTTDGNSHWARSAGRKQSGSAHHLNMPDRTFTFEMYAGNFIEIPWQEVAVCAFAHSSPVKGRDLMYS